MEPPQACKCFHGDGTTSELARVICAATLRGWQDFDRSRVLAMHTSHLDRAERATLDHIKRTGTDGSCIVCQEPGPNIITTCCAAPYHITCLTKWFVSGHNSSCCKCRQEISYHAPRHPPALSAAIPPRARRGVVAHVGAGRGLGGAAHVRHVSSSNLNGAAWYRRRRNPFSLADSADVDVDIDVDADVMGRVRGDDAVVPGAVQAVGRSDPS